MTGVILKSIRETWLITAIFALALFVLEMLLHVILPQFQSEATDLFAQVPFVRTMISALIGADIGETFSALVLQAIIWLHPAILSMIWAHEIILCTRMPAGEIDRGTIDVLLAQPLSRRAIFVAEAIATLASGAFIIASAFGGMRLGARIWMPDDIPALGPSALILANLLTLYIAIAGIACLVSSLCSARLKAIGIVFAIVVGSFLLNFLAQMWPPVQTVSFLGVLEYYRPADILRSGEPPILNVLILLAIGAVTWTSGLEVFARRSIATT